MVKVVRMMPCYQQLCHAHRIQRAVSDTLYKKNNREVEESLTSYENREEEDKQGNTDDDEVINEEYGLTIIFFIGHLMNWLALTKISLKK